MRQSSIWFLLSSLISNYLSVQELIENENNLLFKPEVISTEVGLNDESSEMQEFNKQHSSWLTCRSQAIDLIFSRLYVKHTDMKDSFFNCFLLVHVQLYRHWLSSYHKRGGAFVAEVAAWFLGVRAAVAEHVAESEELEAAEMHAVALSDSGHETTEELQEAAD